MLATEHTLDPEALFTISAGGFSATADAFARDEEAETLWFLSMVGSQTALKAIWACLLKQPPDAAHLLPSIAAGLPRRLHAGRDRPRSGLPGRHRPSAAPQRGEAVSEGESPGGPGGGGAAGGRRVLVYATHTGTRDVTERMSAILAGHGFRVAVMKADAVAPDRREAWVENKVKEGIDVLICHPRLVQTGLDLIAFPTIVWAETDYSVYVMRQASRRSWRIGQTRPVKVVFMAYRGTLQADALKLVAKKLQSSLAVEGELPEDGLAAYGDDGGAPRSA